MAVLVTAKIAREVLTLIVADVMERVFVRVVVAVAGLSYQLSFTKLETATNRILIERAGALD